MHDEYNFKFPEPTKPRAPAPDSADWVRFFTRVALIVLAVPVVVIVALQVVR